MQTIHSSTDVGDAFSPHPSSGTLHHWSTERCARLLYPERSERMRRMRFYLRTLFWFRDSTDWYTFISRHPVLSRVLRYEPDLAEKIHRPYRRAGIGIRKRLALIKNHVAICDRLGWNEWLVQAYRSHYELARMTDREGVEYRVVLARPAQFNKEGELAVHICSSETRIYSAAISLSDGSGCPELDVGCIQGPEKLGNSQETIRRMTRGLHGLRPRSLILEVVRAIGESADCARIRVVDNRRHIYRSWRKKRAISFDYDAFCVEAGGTRDRDGDWLLTAAKPWRPLEEIPSKKRAETRRRRDLIANLSRQIHAALSSRQVVHRPE